MKFVSVFRSDPNSGPAASENYVAMGRLIEEMRGAGVLVDTGGVVPNGASVRVRRNGTDVTTTDGPFAESKEVVGGFAVLNVASRADAIAWTARFLAIAGDGVAELHEVGEIP